MKRFLLFLFAGLFAGQLLAQVNYTQNFEVNNGTWTGATRFTGATACGGSGGALRYNLYSGATTTNITSPSIGTSIGGSTAISFDYKVANWSANTAGTSNPWGTANVQWSNSSTGPWTTVGTIDQSNHIVSGSCANKSYTFTPTAGSLFVRIAVAWSSGDYYFNVDNVVVYETPPPCSGTPAFSATNASGTMFCPGVGTSISFSATGTNVSPTSASYSWQSSPDGSSWTATGGTAATYTATVNSATQYRLAYTCNATGNSAVSPAVSIAEGVQPVAGTATGPATAFTYDAANTLYSLSGSTGTIQWLSGTASPANTTITGATTSSMNLNFSSGGTQYIRARVSGVGCADVFSNEITTAVSVKNNNVCDAIEVSVGNNAGPYTNVGANTETGEPAPPGNGSFTNQGTWYTGQVPGQTIWFKFTVPAGGSGRYRIGVPGWDSQVAIWSAASCGAVLSGGATLMGANDDWGTSQTPVNTGNSATTSLGSAAQVYCLTPGTTYYIQTDGYGTTSNSNINVLVTDLGTVSYTGLATSSCITAADMTLTPTLAGGTFSGPGASGTTFSPATAGAGTHNISYAYQNTYSTGSGTFIANACVTTTTQTVVVAGTATYYQDADADGFGNAAMSQVACTNGIPSGYITDNTDCNDAALTYADGDNDGFGFGTNVACGVTNDDDCDDATLTYADGDNDGFGAGEFTACGVNDNTDCDDTRADVSPADEEVCDENDVDEDCDGASDDTEVGDDAQGQVDYYADVDDDTYGAGNAMNMCNQPDGAVTDNTDCDDNNTDINPAATEICDEADTDEDCDGGADDTEAGDNAMGQMTYYADVDGDTYGAGPAMVMCNQPAGSVLDVNGDCQPTLNTSYPGAPENLCDGIDNNCNGQINELPAGTSCAPVIGLGHSNVTKTQARITWTAQCGIIFTRAQYRKNNTNSWIYRNANAPATSTLVYNLTPATTYLYRARNYCNGNIAGGLSAEQSFTTLAALEAPEMGNTAEAAEVAPRSIATSDVKMFPNPSRGFVELQLNNLVDQTVQIILLDPMGKTSMNWAVGTQNGEMRTSFNVADLPAGVYIVRVQTQEGTVLRTLVKE